MLGDATRTQRETDERLFGYHCALNAGSERETKRWSSRGMLMTISLLFFLAFLLIHIPFGLWKR